VRLGLPLVPSSCCTLPANTQARQGAIETFIVGAALSTTSLGTTFVVIGSAARGVDFAQTKVGVVLISAAVFDDVSGLVMASVIHNLGPVATDSSVNIGWIIGRPIVASAAMGICSPLLTKYLFSPVFRWYIEHYFVKFKHVSNVVLMVLVLCAYITIASYAGASILYGSFLAGTCLSSLPCNHPDAPFMVLSREHGESDPDKTPMFIHTFEKYFLGAQTYILQPVFFASIGFAIPFKKLWTGEAIWKGIVTSILMVIGKAAVGIWVPVWDLLADRTRRGIGDLLVKTWKPATFLGMAMVARGEIGLLIIQIGLNETPYLSEEAFINAAWAIVLNTIIGPVAVGLLLKRHGRSIYNNFRWGAQEPDDGTLWGTDDGTEDGRGSRWTSRRHSRAVSVAASDGSRSRRGSASVSRPPSRRRPSGGEEEDHIEAVPAQSAPMSEKKASSDTARRLSK
jgi:Kef-type K+ transport system membrane component KefB